MLFYWTFEVILKRQISLTGKSFDCVCELFQLIILSLITTGQKFAVGPFCCMYIFVCALWWHYLPNTVTIDEIATQWSKDLWHVLGSLKWQSSKISGSCDCRWIFGSHCFPEIQCRLCDINQLSFGSFAIPPWQHHVKAKREWCLLRQ